MTEIFPNYYDKFKCIADKCRHSCCIGWEIDIDDDTMELYNSIGDENILKNIIPLQTEALRIYPLPSYIDSYIHRGTQACLFRDSLCNHIE